MRSALAIALLLSWNVVACSSESTASPLPDDGGLEAATGEEPACTPACSGKACGPDGCGGTCGTCPADSSCNVAKGTCARGCLPSCAGKSCGDDGCGGSCGACAVGTCQGGKCACAKDGDCLAGERCGFDRAGARLCVPSCSPFDAVSRCAPGEACADLGVERFTGGVYPVCGVVGSGAEAQPCVRKEPFGHDCSPGFLCMDGGGGTNVCARFCDDQHPCPKAGQRCTAIVVDGKAVSYRTCTPAMDACSPNPCKQPHKTVCRVDGSGASCGCDSGYVEKDGACVIPCTPRCDGRRCGGDGCGGSCGECSAPAKCAADFTCCAPSCGGKNCGPDGCGGECGACAKGELCTAGRCEACVPRCAGRVCGDDGCGGSCGRCSLPQVCSGEGRCECTPRCAGKTCGSNGCGGTCGECGADESCVDGSCVACDPVANEGCPPGEGCWLLASGKAVCAVTGTGRQGASCSAATPCAGGHACFAGTCRKICDLTTDLGCALGQTCRGVTGWPRHGACQ